MRPRTVAVRHLGHERQPVAIIDDLAPDPDTLRAAASASAWGPAGRSYPGIRAALPPGYLREIAPILADVLRNVFALSRGARVLDASFSVVTSAPDTLALDQRLPHVDALEPGRLAFLHYLVLGGTDGTAFFRHRSTGFETLDEARSPAYFAKLNAEVRAAAPSGYIAADTPLFERTGVVDGAYNRAVLYRSAMLHSGAITSARTLPADPLTGRLTVTGFLAAN